MNSGVISVPDRVIAWDEGARTPLLTCSHVLHGEREGFQLGFSSFLVFCLRFCISAAVSVAVLRANPGREQ